MDDRHSLSRTQRLFTWLAGPDGAAAMEAHSRAWLVQCPHCGHERSLWEIGGIRYKTAGEPRTRTRLRCPKCGRGGWHRVHKSPRFPTAPAPLWPAIRIILSLSFASLILAALITGIVLKLTGAL